MKPRKYCDSFRNIMGLDKGGRTGPALNSTREHHMNIYKQLYIRAQLDPPYETANGSLLMLFMVGYGD